MEPMIPYDFVYVPTHRVEHVYLDSTDDWDGAPCDICEACSDPERGLWVPASFCPEAKADMGRRYGDRSYQ